MRRSLLAVAGVALAVVAIAGCSAASSSPSPSAAPAQPSSAPAAGGPSPLTGTSWNLATIGADAAAPGSSLVLAADVAGGSGGCNTFRASYTADATNLKFGPAASTMMACEDAKMKQESAYLAALGTVATYKVDGTKLTLSDASGKAVLGFTAAAPASVEGSWDVTGYYDGKSAHVSVQAGTTITMVFDADGQVSGNSGCNTYSGGYSVNGNKIAVGPLMTTRMACPDDVMTQEQQFLAALAGAETWSVRGDTLELRGMGDKFLVNAKAAAGG
jgi:heat shock protein HslJ